MSRSRTLAALVLSAGLLIGCIDESLFAPYVDTLVVHAVLDVDARYQYVIVQQVDTATGTQRQVSGATVTITGPDGLAMLAREVMDSMEFQSHYRQTQVNRVYRLSLDDYGRTFAAGQQYSLRVVTPSGRVITGSTIIPVSPSLLRGANALDTLNVDVDSVVIAWTRSSYATAYEVVMEYRPGGSYEPSPFYRAFADSGFVMAPTSRGRLSYQALYNDFVNEFTVLAVDANYYEFYRRGSNLLGQSGIVNHLTGGVGLFGSVGRVSWQQHFITFPKSTR